MHGGTIEYWLNQLIEKRMIKKSIIQLSAEWCGPCRGLRDNINKNYLSKDEYKDVDYKFIDIDKPEHIWWKNFMEKNGIKSIPFMFAQETKDDEHLLFPVDRHNLEAIFEYAIDETNYLQDSTQETGEASSDTSVQEVQESGEREKV